MEWGLVDFNLGLLPAARNALAGVDPYVADPGFFSPPWVLYPVFPLAPLPDWVATLLWLFFILAASIISLHLSARVIKTETKKEQMLLIAVLLLTPYSLQTWFSGQFTPLVMMGMVGVFTWDAPFVSLLLLSLKPQLGALLAIILLARLVQTRKWKRLQQSILGVGAIIGSSFLLVPNSFSHFTAGLLTVRSLGHHPEWITTIPRALIALGLEEASAWGLYVILALVILGLLVVRHDLPMLVVVSLLIAPYAREYDYVLLTIPAFYLLTKRIMRPLVWILMFLPLHRLFFGDLSWSWLSIIVPLIFLILLIYDARMRPAMHSPPPGVFNEAAGSIGEVNSWQSQRSLER